MQNTVKFGCIRVVFYVLEAVLTARVVPNNNSHVALDYYTDTFAQSFWGLKNMVKSTEIHEDYLTVFTKDKMMVLWILETKAFIMVHLKSKRFFRSKATSPEASFVRPLYIDF